MYTENQIEELHQKSREYFAKCFELQGKILVISEHMSENAKEHAVYGVARRLSTLRECLKFFFESLPLSSEGETEMYLLSQGNINLHAFLINCAGISDNIAWFLAYYYKLNEQIDLEKNKLSIGLFHRAFSKYLPNLIAEKVKEFERWNNHIISFRHPTAHRIPPYLIPYIEFSDTGNRDYTSHYIQAFDKSRPVPLHAQAICDLGAIIELVEALLNSLTKENA